ncbi:hypothetical protein K8I28_01540 [bacterium]|nr:hypothetical protein [bacterium]
MLFGKNKKNQFNVVIVCHANITRSPFFAALLEKQFEYASSSDRKVTISSAGVRAIKGASANQIISMVANLNQLSLARHRSRPFDKSVAKSADLVLTMESYQRDAILEEFPELEGQVFTVLEFGRRPEVVEEYDVSDPTGKDAEDYEEFAQLALKEASRVQIAIESKYLYGK